MLKVRQRGSAAKTSSAASLSQGVKECDKKKLGWWRRAASRKCAAGNAPFLLIALTAVVLVVHWTAFDWFAGTGTPLIQELSGELSMNDDRWATARAKGSQQSASGQFETVYLPPFRKLVFEQMATAVPLSVVLQQQCQVSMANLIATADVPLLLYPKLRSDYFLNATHYYSCLPKLAAPKVAAEAMQQLARISALKASLLQTSSFPNDSRHKYLVDTGVDLVARKGLSNAMHPVCRYLFPQFLHIVRYHKTGTYLSQAIRDQIENWCLKGASLKLFSDRHSAETERNRRNQPAAVNMNEVFAEAEKKRRGEAVDNQKFKRPQDFFPKHKLKRAVVGFPPHLADGSDDNTAVFSDAFLNCDYASIPHSFNKNHWVLLTGGFELTAANSGGVLGAATRQRSELLTLHFIRSPLQTIVSAFNYHRDCNQPEIWQRTPLSDDLFQKAKVVYGSWQRRHQLPEYKFIKDLFDPIRGELTEESDYKWNILFLRDLPQFFGISDVDFYTRKFAVPKQLADSLQIFLQFPKVKSSHLSFRKAVENHWTVCDWFEQMASAKMFGQKTLSDPFASGLGLFYQLQMYARQVADPMYDVLTDDRWDDIDSYNHDSDAKVLGNVKKKKNAGKAKTGNAKSGGKRNVRLVDFRKKKKHDSVRKDASISKAEDASISNLDSLGAVVNVAQRVDDLLRQSLNRGRKVTRRSLLSKKEKQTVEEILPKKRLLNLRMEDLFEDYAKQMNRILDALNFIDNEQNRDLLFKETGVAVDLWNERENLRKMLMTHAVDSSGKGASKQVSKHMTRNKHQTALQIDALLTVDHSVCELIKHLHKVMQFDWPTKYAEYC